MKRVREIFDGVKNVFSHEKRLFYLLPLLFILLFLLFQPRMQSGKIQTSTFTYNGQILASEPAGQGELKYTNGDSYVGGFKSGKFDGQGTYHSASQNWTYVGKFKAGRADGAGEMTTPDGVKHSVTFNEGVIKA